MSNKINTLAAIGTLVVVGQTAERLLDMILTFVIQDGEKLTLKRLIDVEKKHRRKTLGYFIREMKMRAEFDESIEDAFERFLENRNTLVHRFDKVRGHQLKTGQDLEAVGVFLSQLSNDTMTVITFCTALVHAWSEQTGICKATLDEYSTSATEEWIQQIKGLSTLMDHLVFKKG